MSTNNIGFLASLCAPWISHKNPNITLDELLSEEWAPVPSLPGVTASTCGRVRFNGKLLHQRYRGTSTFYPGVSLDRVSHFTHVLVAEAFLGAKSAGMEVDHIDGNPFNNRVENLRYLTPAQNKRAARVRRRLRGLPNAPWMAIYDVIAAGLPKPPQQPGGCSRGHSAKDRYAHGGCRACRNISISISHEMGYAHLMTWVDEWTATMTHEVGGGNTGVVAIPVPPQDPVGGALKMKFIDEELLASVA